MRCSTSRAVGLSSTTSARSGIGGGPAGASSSATSEASRSVIWKWKRLPWPSALSRCSSPPIRPTSRWLIATPSPVPPKRRVVEASACVKPLKMRAWFSGAMPMPVSRTAISIVTSVAPIAITVTDTTTSPAAVNLIALPVRLISTCCRRKASPIRRHGRAASMSNSTSRFLAPMLADTMTDRSRIS